MASVPDMVKKQPARIAVIFPGQGSQAVAMTSELAEIYPEIRDTFTEASEALGEDLWAICQDEEKLNQTVKFGQFKKIHLNSLPVIVLCLMEIIYKI